MHFHSPVGNENKGVDAVEPASSDSPPDCRILDLRIHPPFFHHKKPPSLRTAVFRGSIELNVYYCDGLLVGKSKKNKELQHFFEVLFP